MKSTQRGITLIETVGAIAVGTMMLVGLSAMINSSMGDLKGQQVAYYHAQVVSAARAYIKNNSKDIKNNAGPPVNNNVVEVSVPTLIAGGYLPQGFALRNPYNQSTCILIRQPLTDRLDALVVTTGGERIADRHLPYIASQAGQGNGYITRDQPTVARGSSWSVSTAPWINKECETGGPFVLTGEDTDGGHLASNIFHDSPGEIESDFLHRYHIPSMPELNKMHTSILFTGDAIVNEGTACGDHAGITFNASRELLFCEDDKKWKRVTPWRATVATHADLLALPAPKEGDMRIVKDKQRAFIYTGTAWQALAVDQNGNLIVEGELKGAQVSAVDVMITPELALSGDPAAWKPGDACHQVVTMPNGDTQIWYAMGSVVRTTDGYILICKRYTPDLAAEYPTIAAPATGYAWTYPNGKYKPVVP